MSIIIHGMDMPTNEELWIRIQPDGKIVSKMGYVIEDASAEQLPSHGRLIDENDVMKSAEELRKSQWLNDEPYHVMRKDGFEMAIDMAVKDAPTIIEAEER